MASPTSRPAPAASAAGPNAENTPAPIIDPRPMATASPSPRRRSSRLGASRLDSLTGRRRSVVVPDELDLDSATLVEERGVHTGEVAPVRCLTRVHARLDQALVDAV